jgi:hypothetical protein
LVPMRTTLEGWVARLEIIEKPPMESSVIGCRCPKSREKSP